MTYLQFKHFIVLKADISTWFMSWGDLLLVWELYFAPSFHESKTLLTWFHRKSSIFRLSYMLKTLYKPEGLWSRTKTKSIRNTQKSVWILACGERIPSLRKTWHLSLQPKGQLRPEKHCCPGNSEGPRLRGPMVSVHPLEREDDEKFEDLYPFHVFHSRTHMVSMIAFI